MADTTTRYAFPFQEAGDPPDGASLGEDLAEAIETTVGGIDDRLDDAEDTIVTLDTRLDTAESDIDTLQAPPLTYLVQQATQTMANNATNPIEFATGATVIDSHNFHNEASNNTRVTPTVAGYYHVQGKVAFGARSDHSIVDAFLRKNGSTTILGSSGRINYSRFTGATNSTASTNPVVFCESIVYFNGSTDYIEMLGVQTNVAAGSSSTGVTGQFASTLKVEFIRA